MRGVRRTALFSLYLATSLFAPLAWGASLEKPEAAGMRHVGKNIYVDPELSGDQVERAVKLVNRARKRVELFYGDVLARPKIVFCASADCYREFGAVGLGFTDGINLVVSPDGMRVAILAHELAHVEFSARVGGFAKVLEGVPQWFDEGQAVMVSMADEFSEEAWNIATDDGKDAPPLDALATMEDWVRLTGANGECMQLTYGTAKQEVSRWFSHSGQEGFQALLRALRNNEAFAEAYSRIEAFDGQDVIAGQPKPEASPDAPFSPGNLLRAAW